MYLFVLGLGLLISCAIALYYVQSPTFSLFHPFTLYTAFHFLIFVIRPIFAYALDYESIYHGYGFMPSMADKITVILAANLGYVAFAFTCLRAGNVPVTFRADACTIEERKRLIRLFVWVMAICLPWAIYSMTQNFNADSGNYAGQMLDRSKGVTINTKANGYITDAQLMLAPLCAIFAWLNRFRLLSLIPMGLFVVMRGSTGGRGPFIAGLVMLLLLYLYERRLRFPGFRFAIAAVFLASLFSWVGQDRGEAMRQNFGMEEKTEARTNRNADFQFMETMDLANMEFFEYIVWVVPQRSGTYDYFLANLQLFTEPVPRVLWPGKPVGSPFQPVKIWDYGSPIGMTASVPGMGWYFMGWLGVIIWCGLWGFASGTLYRRFFSGDQSTMKTAAYMVFVATLVLGFRDGSLVSLTKQTGVYLAPIMLWYVFARYVGTPTLSQLRMQDWMKRRMQPAAPVAASAAPAAEAAAPKAAGLPPAVRRRREALARQGTSPVGG